MEFAGWTISTTKIFFSGFCFSFQSTGLLALQLGVHVCMRADVRVCVCVRWVSSSLQAFYAFEDVNSSSRHVLFFPHFFHLFFIQRVFFSLHLSFIFIFKYFPHTSSVLAKSIVYNCHVPESSGSSLATSLRILWIKNLFALFFSQNKNEEPFYFPNFSLWSWWESACFIFFFPCTAPSSPSSLKPSWHFAVQIMSAARAELQGYQTNPGQTNLHWWHQRIRFTANLLIKQDRRTDRQTDLLNVLSSCWKSPVIPNSSFSSCSRTLKKVLTSPCYS